MMYSIKDISELAGYLEGLPGDVTSRLELENITLCRYGLNFIAWLIDVSKSAEIHLGAFWSGVPKTRRVVLRSSQSNVKRERDSKPQNVERACGYCT